MSKHLFTDKEVTEKQRTMADAIKDKMSIDKSTGVITVPDDIFKEVVTDVTPEDFKKVMTGLGDFGVASAVAAGEVSVEAMSKHKDLASTSVSLPLDKHSKVTHVIHRHKSGPIPGSNDRWNKYACLTSGVTLGGLTANKGALGKVARKLSEEAASVLG